MFGVTSSLLPLSVASKWGSSSTASSATCSTSSSQRMDGDRLESAKAEALWGMCIGDALAMPVHWYYNPSDIVKGYGGWLTGYKAPNDRHPSSILNLSSTGGSGRSGWQKNNSKQIVGDVILHDKLKYWKKSSSVHYHRGMQAGDNTLNALTALEFIKVFQKADPSHSVDLESLQAQVMERYVSFMTTPGSHNDTYAESFHRSFFKDWADMENPPTNGQDIVSMAEDRYHNVLQTGHEDHQLPVIGALVVAIPWILHYAHASADDCAKATVSALHLTHPAPSLEPYIDAYARLLHAVVNGKDLKEEALKTIERIGKDRKKRLIEEVVKESKQFADTESRLALYQEATSILGSACYIDGAMASMLTLALGFHDDFSAGVLTNANCGGENAHRGAALGALLGANAAIHGSGIPIQWKSGLNSAKTTIQSAVAQPI